jgi:hypothetical protein
MSLVAEPYFGAKPQVRGATSLQTGGLAGMMQVCLA